MQNKGLLIGLGVLVVVVLAGAIIYSSGVKGPNYGSVPSPTPLSTVQPSVQPGEVKEVSVEGGEYKFSPDSISVVAGEKVQVNFKNTGRLPHNLSLDELNFATDTIPGGKTTSAEFTASKTGSFTMYCSVGNHRSLGMEGKVEVK